MKKGRLEQETEKSSRTQEDRTLQQYLDTLLAEDVVVNDEVVALQNSCTANAVKIDNLKKGCLEQETQFEKNRQRQLPSCG